MSPAKSTLTIHQRDIVQLREPGRFHGAVVISADALQASGQVLIAPIVNRRDPIPYVELPLEDGTAISLVGLRPIRTDRVTKIIGHIEPEQLDTLLLGLDLICNR